ncbi:hypothetical protein HDV06_000883 [Boothiomyces sp. JEL0866]|nr:hypothetical protein HDV06_000883 [Boothiomyces sp. JEL0866]
MNQNILFGEYHLEGVLGQGSFAIVYRARHLPTNQTVAIKCIDLKKAQTTFSKEVEILEQLQSCSFVIHLLEHFETGDNLYMVLEYCKKDLFDAIVTDGLPIDSPIVFTWFHQICTAIEQMHGKNLYHRDIKLENILINEYNEATLTDFGLSTENQFSTHKVGTEAYMPPECFNMAHKSKLKQTFSSEKSDVWALGVMLILMLAREHPWDIPSYEDPQYRRHFYTRTRGIDTLRREFGFSDELCRILRKVFSPEPSLRPTVRDFKYMIENLQSVYPVEEPALELYEMSLISGYGQAIRA